MGFELTNQTAEELIAQARKKRGKPNGYAARPGSGPEGEKCRTCKHAVGLDYSKTYYKCKLRRRDWTGSYGTDIRLKSPA